MSKTAVEDSRWKALEDAGWVVQSETPFRAQKRFDGHYKTAISASGALEVDRQEDLRKRGAREAELAEAEALEERARALRGDDE